MIKTMGKLLLLCCLPLVIVGGEKRPNDTIETDLKELEAGVPTANEFERTSTQPVDSVDIRLSRLLNERGAKEYAQRWLASVKDETYRRRLAAVLTDAEKDAEKNQGPQVRRGGKQDLREWVEVPAYQQLIQVLIEGQKEHYEQQERSMKQERELAVGGLNASLQQQRRALAVSTVCAVLSLAWAITATVIARS